VRPIETRAPVE